MSQPVLLVTGAWSGIGLATSVAVARAGSRTVATMRNLDKADVLRTAAAEAGVEIDVRRLDVVDELSIRSCIAATVDT
jgi:NAD(P)-dependent dehydrogenase (short-subunit alcohol dehydrogenase family)